MIDTAYVRRMARYNRWQNENLYGCADALPDEERRRERGAFFGSIHKTFNHLLWADRIWMSRFTGGERPPGTLAEALSTHEDWSELRRERAAYDETIVGWADAMKPAWLADDLAYYSVASQRNSVKPKAMLVVHFFNHQTHHRGQVHCMLTQAGGKPDDTDLPILAE